MPDYDPWLKLLWTFFAATFGVICGQVAIKLLIDPVAYMQRLVGDTGATLLARQRKILNHADDPETGERLRAHAGQLRTYIHFVPIAGLWGLPSKARIKEAAGLLNLLAYRVEPDVNGKHDFGETLEALKRLRELLRIPTQYSDPLELDGAGPRLSR